MASFKNGNIKGKLGKVVAFEQHGRNYLRQAPNRTAAPSPAELKNRHLLELLTAWLRPVIPVLRKGFRNYSWNFEGFNAAFSVNYKEALQKNGYDSTIDPSLVKISSGDLGLPANLQVSLNDRDLEFTWTPAVNRSQSPRDRALLLAYSPITSQSFYQLTGAIRYQGHDRLSLSQAQPGTFHIYAAFVAEDGGRQSESQYLGEVNIE